MTVSNAMSPVQQLADVLRESGASPRVKADSIVRSTLYDLDYHVALISCVFMIAADEDTANSRTIVAHWLKIIQFIAVRPTLLLDFQDWAKARRFPDLETWQKMPRGYLGDNTHDRTVELLVAKKILIRTGDKLSNGERFIELRQLYENIVAKDIFRSERFTLLELGRTAVNKTLLKGE